MAPRRAPSSGATRGPASGNWRRWDAATGRMSGPATRALMRRRYEAFGDEWFERLAGLSNGHLYNPRFRGGRLCAGSGRWPPLWPLHFHHPNASPVPIGLGLGTRAGDRSGLARVLRPLASPFHSLTSQRPLRLLLPLPPSLQACLAGQDRRRQGEPGDDIIGHRGRRPASPAGAAAGAVGNRRRGCFAIPPCGIAASGRHADRRVTSRSR